MKAIVLAGGSGTRLRPLTAAVSKQLLPVFDKPMIYYALSSVMSAQVKDVLIITSPQDSEAFRRLLGDGSNLGAHFSYAQQPVPAGIAEAFLLGSEFLSDAKSTLLVLGDNLFHGDAVSEFTRVPDGFSGARIFGYHVSNPHDYGVVELAADGTPIGLEEKPSAPRSSLAVPGIYVYDTQVVEIARKLRPSPRGELEITHVNRAYMDMGLLDVRVLPRGTAWLDTGTFESLLDASSYVKAIEHRQGVKIGCIEEVAWRNGWISDEELMRLSAHTKSSGYGVYLERLLQQSD